MPRNYPSKRERIKNIIQALYKLPYPENIDKKSMENEFYPFSNERGLEDPIQTLRNTKITLYPRETIRVAILTGQSSFCSLLPELAPHCDLIVLNDINPYLRQHLRLLLNLLLKSHDCKNFENRYEKILKEEDLPYVFPSQVTPDLAMRKKTLGKFHFLDSEKRFLMCQSAARSLDFVFSHSDLFQQEHRKGFFDLFSEFDAKITFLNLTNLYEWDAKKPLTRVKSFDEWEPLHNIQKIFLSMGSPSPSPIMMGSLRENSVESCALKAKLFFNFESYLNTNEDHIRKFIEQKFTPSNLPTAEPITSDHGQIKKPITPYFSTVYPPPAHQGTLSRNPVPVRFYFQGKPKI